MTPAYTCTCGGSASKPGVESETAVRPSPSDGPMAEADTGSPPRDTLARTCLVCGEFRGPKHAETCYGRPRGAA